LRGGARRRAETGFYDQSADKPRTNRLWAIRAREVKRLLGAKRLSRLTKLGSAVLLLRTETGFSGQRVDKSGTNRPPGESRSLVKSAFR
jgi:hypothetical protein